MNHQEGSFIGAEGIELYYQSWSPDSEPKAFVAIVHGVGEHGGRYAHVVDALPPAGYALYAFDQRGHGRSPGRRVHIDSWTQYREDLRAFLRMVARQADGKPVVVYGHSMGALVVLDYLLERPAGLAGAIVSGSPIEPAGVASPQLIAVARVLSGIVPRMHVKLGLDVNGLSRDPQVVAEYVADPLVTAGATARWGTESLATVERIKARMSAIDLPILILHGGADPLNTADGARALFDAVASADKTLKLYADGLHEPHNDLQHDEVVADILAWLQTRT
jgi:alpha-beta hydrolase superfamily lysophospholipase